MDLIKVKDLPADAKVSEDMKQRARLFISISYYGHSCYIPVEHHMKRILKIRIRNGEPEISFDGAAYLERFLRDIIAAVYFQVRDTVGNEIHQDLSSKLQKGFERYFNENLKKLIENNFSTKDSVPDPDDEKCPYIQCPGNAQGECVSNEDWHVCERAIEFISEE